MDKSILLTLVVSCILLFSSSLVAGGLGIVFAFGSGTTDYDWYKADANQRGLNFVFDTNVAKRSVFNYRLTAGFEIFRHVYDIYDYNYKESLSYLGTRIVTDHAFGFGIVKTYKVRLWMGPNVRFGYIGGKHTAFIVGAGVTVLGLNYNLGPVLTVALEGGYLYNVDLYNDRIDFLADEDLPTDSGISNLFVVKILVLFRFKDTYDDNF